mmetsp:Transcript_113417/g.316850  ORF Transcript_113417/g.316850 Transcript_113417/m.316850 type:complete len:377 (+) Transcript_113417:63-1193(+)
MGCAGTKIDRVVACSTSRSPAAFDQILPAAAPCDFHAEYRLAEKLGSGSFGLVYAARRVADGEDVAVKAVDMCKEDVAGRHAGNLDRRRQRAVETEIAILHMLPRSANVITFLGAYVEDGLAYLVMERCSLSLLPYLHSMPVLTEAALKPAFEDMLRGIAACHSAGIVHRDVKCDNFLAAPRCGGPGHMVKLCDFGCATRIRPAAGRALAGVCGTAPYMAPEMVRGEGYGAGVDVWAMGVLAHVLLFGAWPYMPPALSGPDVKRAIAAGTPAPAFRSGPSLPEVSADCAAWVRSLLCRDPTGRPSAKQALASRSLRAEWGRTTSLDKALCAAVRCGAFERPGRAFEARQELDETLSRLNSKQHSVSEASTDASEEL